MAQPDPLPDTVPVLIAGGGPVGLATAALLARQGVASLVVEADEGYCSGSRAICISRRSQEILWAAGAGPALAAKALPWTGGRSYWRDREVLRFEMPSEPTQRFAPMVNIQQYHVERFLHEALLPVPELARVAWAGRVAGLQQQGDAVNVEVDTAAGRKTSVPITSSPAMAGAARCASCWGCSSKARSTRAATSSSTSCSRRSGRWNAWPGSIRRPTPGPRC